jgi:hypothetical protein
MSWTFVLFLAFYFLSVVFYSLVNIFLTYKEVKNGQDFDTSEFLAENLLFCVPLVGSFLIIHRLITVNFRCYNFNKAITNFIQGK